MNAIQLQTQTQSQTKRRKIGVYYNPYDYKVYIVWLKDKIIHIKDSFKLSDTANLIIFAKMLHKNDEIIYASSHLKHKEDELEFHNAITVIKNNTDNFNGHTLNIKEASLIKAIHNLQTNYSNYDHLKHTPEFYAIALAFYAYK